MGAKGGDGLAGVALFGSDLPDGDVSWHPSPSDDTGDTMMLSLYFTLGVFLLLAARKPSAHRSLIVFAACSSFAHAVVMTVLGFHMPSERVGFLSGSAVLVVICVALLAAGSGKGVSRADIGSGRVGSHSRWGRGVHPQNGLV
jgi:hypothetical protein